MNTKSRIKIYLVLILLTGVGLAFAVPALVQAHASTRGDRLSPTAAAKIIYVAKSGDGSDGLTWTTAYTDLQHALAEAISSDQIWVATGVYIPGASLYNTFQLVPGVALYGGFAPVAGADQFTERDWGAYPTILSGDIAGDDSTDARGVVTTTDHIVGSNSYHVVRADGTSTPVTVTTLLDGFTITAGQANGGIPDNQGGGGYYCDGSGSGGECSPNLRNITFSGNSADYGGAMYNHGYQGSSSPTLTKVTFSGNSAGAGGAMNNNGEAGNSKPSLREVTFSGNSADDGGAMYNYGHNGTSSPSLDNVTFSGNSADINGGAMYNDGDEGTSSPSLANVNIAGNSAEVRGGAMYNSGYQGSSSPSLANVTFAGNLALHGGAMYNNGAYGASSPSLANVTFSGNSAGNVGGAMYNYGVRGTSSPSAGSKCPEVCFPPLQNTQARKSPWLVFHNRLS